MLKNDLKLFELHFSFIKDAAGCVEKLSTIFRKEIQIEKVYNKGIFLLFVLGVFVVGSSIFVEVVAQKYSSIATVIIFIFAAIMAVLIDKTVKKNVRKILT